MTDPFSRDYAIVIWSVAYVTGVVSAAAMAPLLSDLRPKLVSLELAKSAAEVHAITRSWSNKQRKHVRWSLPIDCVFALSYAAFLATTCILLPSPRFHVPRFLTIAAPVFALLAPLAGLADIIENAGMALELAGKRANALLRLTSTASRIKWTLAAVVVVYLITVACWIEAAWLVRTADATWPAALEHLHRWATSILRLL